MFLFSLLEIKKNAWDTAYIDPEPIGMFREELMHLAICCYSKEAVLELQEELRQFNERNPPRFFGLFKRYPKFYYYHGNAKLMTHKEYKKFLEGLPDDERAKVIDENTPKFYEPQSYIDEMEKEGSPRLKDVFYTMKYETPSPIGKYVLWPLIHRTNPYILIMKWNTDPAEEKYWQNRPGYNYRKSW